MIISSILSSFKTAFRKRSIFGETFYRSKLYFSETKQPSSIDQLKNYEGYLTKFNESIRKPHEKQQRQQQRIIQTYINQKRYSQIIEFLLRNTGNTLCSTTTASRIDVELANNWLYLHKKDQNSAAHALSYFRETKVFDIFKKQIEREIKFKGIQGIEYEQLIVYLCGQLTNRKSLRFISKLYPKTAQRFQIYDKIYKYLDKKGNKGVYQRQKRNLLSYIGLMLDPTLNKKEDNIALRFRSPLQITIQSFMKVLQIQYQRQVKINNFYVDYLITFNGNNQKKSFVVEVNGNHHYNINGQLKGKEILRNLIINEYAPLRIIHYQDFLASKGHRNKLAYIDSLFEEKVINWECRNYGKNSRWQVKIDGQLMEQN